MEQQRKRAKVFWASCAHLIERSTYAGIWHAVRIIACVSVSTSSRNVRMQAMGETKLRMRTRGKPCMRMRPCLWHTHSSQLPGSVRSATKLVAVSVQLGIAGRCFCRMAPLCNKALALQRHFSRYVLLPCCFSKLAANASGLQFSQPNF